jgi:antitoxin PrlF
LSKINDNVVSLTDTVKEQQLKIEGPTERVIRLGATLELMMRTCSGTKKLPLSGSKLRNRIRETMASPTVTSKGQVTIPVDIRNQLGLGAGDRIEFIFNDETGRYEIVPANRSVTALKGIIGKPAKP